MFTMKDICIEGNPLLREKCVKVKFPLTQDDENLIKELLQYVIISENDELVKQFNIRPGVGIAAPQVGSNKRMFAMNCTDFLSEKQEKYCFALINPEILAVSEELVYLPDGEGCLSVERDTNKMVTPRHLAIKFKAAIYDFKTGKVKNVTKTFTGYPAIVFQHEYDHLDGILFVDKLFKREEAPGEPLFTYE